MESDGVIFNKVARNAPCPCNSGKRFKHCHGSFRAETGIDLPQHVRKLLDKRREAAEMLRKRQQGYGRPMITAEIDGTRYVQVGTTLAYSRLWKHVPHFLIDNMKRVIGHAWGSETAQTKPDHPIIRWLSQLAEVINRTPAGRPLELRGGVAALLKLAYAFYLIEHNDRPQKNVIARLRAVSDFAGACYEMIVASAFAVAGAKIEGAEEESSSERKPEFIATFSDGRTYAVEAKRKKSWRNAFDLNNSEFQTELRKWLRRMLFESSKKCLENPVYWFELSIPQGLTSDQAELLHSLIVAAIADAESITIAQQPPEPAYVVVTNFPEFSSDDAPGGNMFAILHGFRMEEMRDAVIDLEEAMDRHDNQRCIRRVLQTMTEVQTIPNSFAGVPDELLDEAGIPFQPIRLGDRIAYPTQDGTESTGIITEITGEVGDKAFLVVRDDVTGKHVIITAPLTPQVQAAAAKHGDMVFGKPADRHKVITDPLEMYDSWLEMLADHSHDSLLLQIKSHPSREKFARLSHEELHVRVAREMTKSAYHHMRQRVIERQSKERTDEAFEPI